MRAIRPARPSRDADHLDPSESGLDDEGDDAGRASEDSSQRSLPSTMSSGEAGRPITQTSCRAESTK